MNITCTIHDIHNSQLTPYINHYVTVDFSSMPHNRVEIKGPPAGFPMLQFHFGGNTNYYRHKHFTDQSLFIGQHGGHTLVYPTRETKLLSVNFKPYGLYNLLGISPHGFKNSGMESRLFFGDANVNRITNTLKNDGIENGISELESLLLNFQNSKVKSLPYFDDLVEKINTEHGLIKCTDVLNKTVSVRTIQRYFREVIGISPKLFCQILRHKHILELLYKNPELKWSDLQLKGFYYDFAHFTKDFTRFSGSTPKRYLPLKNGFAVAFLKSH